MYKFEMHIHTSECDPYALVNGAGIAKQYCKIGYQGIIITDHYTKGYFNRFAKELESRDHNILTKRFLKGYYSAKKEGEKLGLTVLCGAEVALNNNANHYLIYGLEEEDFYNLPLLYEPTNLDELIKILPEKALIVQAHPFRNNMTVCDPEKLFGYEVFNNGTKPIRNQLAKTLAEHYNKPMTSGSDCHSIEATGKGGIKSKQKILSQNDLINILKNREYEIIEP